MVLPGSRRSKSMCEAYRAAWREVLAPVANDGLGPVTVLRDYHAENIMLVDGREGVGHFGLLDFQDALAGHPPMISRPCWRMPGATCRPAIERTMIDRYVAGDRRTARRSSAPIGRSRRSATRESSASSRGCGSATTSRTIAASSRECGACWSATWSSRT